MTRSGRCCACGGRSIVTSGGDACRWKQPASRITSRDWDLYDGQHVVFKPTRLSEQELLEGHEEAWRYVYKRRNIVRRLAKSRLQIPLSIASNWGYRFYANNLHTHYNCDWFIGQDGAPNARANA